MQAALSNVLKHIKLEQQYFGVFENSKITKAELNSRTKQYLIDLEMDDLIDCRYWDEFISAKMNNFKNASIKVILKNQPSLELLQPYYVYFINFIMQGSPIGESLVGLNLSIENASIIVECPTEIIFNSLEKIKNQLQYMFNGVGVIYKVELKKCYIKADEELIKKMQEKVMESPVVSTAKEEAPKFEANKNFYNKGYIKMDIHDITNDDGRVEVVGRVFQVEVKETKRGNKYSIFITDDSDSLQISARETALVKEEVLAEIADKFTKGIYVRVRGGNVYDSWVKGFVFQCQQIEIIDVDDKRKDLYDGEKRVELHLHSKMSALDGVTSIEDYINTAIAWGHKAIAVTDHGVVQAFPDAQKACKGKPIKMIYGLEGYVADIFLKPVTNPQARPIDEKPFVVFDFETTGLSNHFDRIIEIGMVKVVNGEIVDRLQTFINPLMRIPQKVVELTHITNDMVIGAPTIQKFIPTILNFIQGCTLVAHNGTFDYGMLVESLKRYDYGKVKNTLVDTLDLARCLYPDLKRYTQGSVAKHLGISYEDDEAHRADYDAEVLSNIWKQMLHDIKERGIVNDIELNNLTPENHYKKMFHPYHTTFLAKNPVGLKNMFKMVSMSHIDYITSYPLIPKHRIEEFREGLLVGSGCLNGEIFDLASRESLDNLAKAMDFYDFIEIQPLDNYKFLLNVDSTLTEERLIQTLKNIVNVAKQQGKLVVATGDCHYLNPRDKIYRDVYIATEGLNHRPHPLFRKGLNEESPAQHFRTTQEMIDGISFLDDIALQTELVVTNTNLIADMCEPLEPVKDKLFTPHFADFDIDKYLTDTCHENARKLYGNPLPQIVEERMEKELNNIIKNGYGVIYWSAQKLVAKSNSDGYLVGSRGSVGSSFVASLCKITEVNPLAPHYLCPNCQHSEFFLDGSVRSGFDLEDKICPVCGHMMSGNGQNIPFETFLGLNGDKVPDIDLNFSRDYQAQAHDYTKVMFGENNVFRAGTISTVASKTAFGKAKDYFKVHNIAEPSRAEMTRLAVGCQDVKRTTGQHPAGIIVVPNDMDIYDFTPIQYPADEPNATWKTTHFKFEAIHDEILKLDILGHLDPMALKMLRDLTGINPEDIPMNDPQVLQLFTGLESLGVAEYDVQSKIGTSGVPEFGTKFVKDVVVEAKPTKFSDLVQISGLTHGTDVWLTNAQDLIKSGEHTISDVIGCRDDIMSDLIHYGMDNKTAFDIMEFVRKGKPSKDPVKWAKHVEKMKESNVPDWYIDSCAKIKYMFPKAHAVAYVVMALRVAWFKVHYPLHYYAAYFTVRCDKYDIATMIQGHDAILAKMQEYKQQMQARDHSLIIDEKYDTLELALEMTARGYKFENISISKSDGTKFIVNEENNSLIPPFNTLDGLGDAVAEAVIKARNEKPFTSKKDFSLRSHINQTTMKTLESMGCLKELVDENQLSFDLFSL